MDTLEQFRDTYITECLELLAQMEDELLELDESADSEKLNAIFRCAHSIKGGAGAFGFTAIAGFTHILEALLDKLRDGELAVTRELTDLLLKARDIVMQMVIAVRDGQELPQGFGAEIEAQLKVVCDQKGGETPSLVSAISSPTSPRGGGDIIYRITFEPLLSLINTGNEPLLLLRELARLGSAAIECDMRKLPPFAEMQADMCYLSWKITLETDQPESAIREVFEFVEDECKLEISQQAVIPESNFLSEQSERLENSDIRNPEQQTGSQIAPLVYRSEAADSRASGMTNKENTAPPREAISSIRVDIDKVDRLINMVGEIVITQAMLAMQGNHLPTQQYPDLIRGIDELTQHTRELQEAVMAVRMQPVKSIFSRMPRLVRDLSAQLGKDIRMEMVGEATEVDKTIIEQLSDPLTHMIRNSVDHGIEMPEVRKEKDKSAQGCIKLSAEHRGGKIIITIADDGQGINREKVLRKAKEKGVIAAEAQLTENEIDMLIFAAGFSTAEAVTSVYGRGVGMDVVKRNIESLGGTVTVINNPEKGSQFIIALPLTLAILDGMVVRVANEQYIIPISNIIETMRPKAEEVKAIADGSAVINVRGEFVPVLYLHHLFNIFGAVKDASKALVVLVENGDATLGLVVDELVGQQQVVIKSLEENSDPIEGISGATILGDGKVSLILDIMGLCKMKQPSHEKRSAA
jgi:two-component system chemotaxis sensor kinase CheA